MAQLSTSLSGYRRSQNSPQIIREKLQRLKSEQNILIGVSGGLMGGVLGAGFWAMMTWIAQHPVSWMAIPCAFLVGYGVRILGNGIDKGFGICGVVLIVLDIFLGCFLTSLIVPVENTLPALLDSIFRFGRAVTWNQLLSVLPMFDILFYAIAIVISYNASFRHITRQQLLRESQLREAIHQ